MDWNLEGKRVEGYCLETYFVRGTVTNSRVKYGATVQHTVQLDDPIVIFDQERTVAFLDDNDVVVIPEDDDDR